MKRCDKCGFENNADALFCNKCGASLDTPRGYTGISRKQSLGYCIAAIACGPSGAYLSCLPSVFIFGIAASVCAIVFGRRGMDSMTGGKRRMATVGRGFGIAGCWLAVIGLTLTIVYAIGVGSLLREIIDAFNKGITIG